MFRLQQGLESATLLLSIMTLNNVDRRVISEDAIEACISLLKHLLSMVQTSCSALSRTVASKMSPKRKRNGESAKETNEAGPVSWSKYQVSMYRKIHSILMKLAPNVIALMSRMKLLIDQVSLDDRQGKYDELIF